MDNFLKYSSVVLAVYSFVVIFMIYFRLKTLSERANSYNEYFVEVNKDDFDKGLEIFDIEGTETNTAKEIEGSILNYSHDLGRIPSNFQRHRAMSRKNIVKAFRYPIQG